MKTLPSLGVGMLTVLSHVCHVTAGIPAYLPPEIYARTGITAFRLPAGSSIASATAGLNDARQVVVDVNYVGDTGNPGMFFGEAAAGGIVFNATDTISGDPTVNNAGFAALTVGLDEALYVYDRAAGTSQPINYPLGVTGSSGLQLSGSGLFGGRFDIGFSGDVLGTFTSVGGSGFPTLQPYVADRGLDASSRYSFLYTPDLSGSNGPQGARIAAKVSTTAGFDFEEIRIFDADLSSQLVAVETETDPLSPFSEFVTNGVTISNNGQRVAFQALDRQGVSGIYRYDAERDVAELIAQEGAGMVATIDIFSPDVNDMGLVVFRGDDMAGRSSVFVGDGKSVFRVFGEGDTLLTDLGPRQLGRRDLDFSQSGAPRINNLGDISAIFQYYDPDQPSSVADGSLVLLRPVSLLPDGDFNDDGSLDCSDIDQLVAAIAAGENDGGFDLTGDGNVDLADRDAWLAEAGAANLMSGAAYLIGDANLDGTVDVSDFNAWNTSKFTPATAWCLGDFNADGTVDVSDFNLWNVNKFQTAGRPVAVPEMASPVWLVGFLLALRRGAAVSQSCFAKHVE